LRSERIPDKKNPQIVLMEITSKDGRDFKFQFQNEYLDKSERVQIHVMKHIFSEYKKDLFAFEYGKHDWALEEKHRGWDLYNIYNEFKRQGIDILTMNTPFEPGSNVFSL
jgi:hypothetical protein